MTRGHADRDDFSRAAVTAFALALILLTAACASSFEEPAPVDLAPLRARAVTKTDDGIRVSAATPDAHESRSIFGVDLEEYGIQPLWLKIENGSERLFYLLRTGLDPEYFAPLEVAFLYEGTFNDQGAAALGELLQALSFDSRSPIRPGETVSGFAYVNRADPTMMVDVDLVGREWSDRIGMVVPVPGTEEAQQRLAALAGLHAETEVVEIGDDATLRTALENLPCCASDESGASTLPLNVVLIGALDDWGRAVVRRNYRYTPASPWLVYGRSQDLSGRKISRWVPPQPHTLRIWLTPLRYQGKAVWVGLLSTRLGGRFAATEQAKRIDPDLDEARNDLVQDLLYSQGVSKIGFVEGAGPAGAVGPRQTQTPYRTDGLRAVLLFGQDTVSLAEIDFFNWERLADHSQRNN
jgi:LssY C-terminus